MLPSAVATRRILPALDRRIWVMGAAICVFAVLVMKEVSLPAPLILGAGVLGLLALLMLGANSPEIPFYVLVAYLPFSRMLVGDFGTHATALNLTNILTLWVLIAHLLRQGGRGQTPFQATPLNKAIILFSLLGAVSLVRAGWLYGSAYAWHALIPLKRWLTPMFLYFVTLWVVRDRRVLKTTASLIMIAVTVVAVMAIRDYMWVADSSFEGSRIGGIAEHSNTLAAFFVYYMFLLSGFFLIYYRKPRAWWLLGPFLLCFRGIMVTFSRGGYLAFAVAGLAACWFRSKLLFAAAVGTLVLLVVNPMLLPSGIRYRMGMTIVNPLDRPAEELSADELTQDLEGSSASRIKIWLGAIEMIKEHPMWGVGYETFPHFIRSYTRGEIGYMDAHNSYLLIAAEMGIPTLLVFLLVLAMVWHYTRWLYWHAQDTAIKAIALGFLAGLAGLAVANMFGSRMDHAEVSGYFWVLCGLVMRAVVMEREDARPRAARRKGAR
jgi:putative inorganic carbon (HCO3(-)) transporter